jgi:hypothetical protein
MSQKKEKRPPASKSEPAPQPSKPKSKKKNIVVHRRGQELLTLSVGNLPFRNKRIKNTLVPGSSVKSISKFETSEGFGEKQRLNGEYYGDETSLSSRKKHRSGDLSPKKASRSKEKSKRLNIWLAKAINRYRALQQKHR